MQVDHTPVMRFLDALSQRDFAAALRAWHSDGVWHLGGQHDLVGDYVARDYVAFLQKWFEDHPSYAVVSFTAEGYGTDVVVAHLETTGGRAVGRASGLMIFRVQDGAIAEGWAIPTTHQGAEPF